MRLAPILPILLAVLMGAWGCGASGCGGSQASSGPGAPTTPIADTRPPSPPPNAEEQASFAMANNRLGADLWRRLREDGQTGNLALSPLSISSALTMTYGGATGATAEAMAQTLHLSGSRRLFPWQLATRLRV